MKKFIKMKTKILSILALLLMTVTQGAWAQETLTVYDGTADNQYIPMYGYSFDYYTKSECIIPASELTAMEGGTITAITFYAATVTGPNPTFGTANQKVFLKEVSETTLSSYSGMTGATVVFDGTLPMPTTSASGYTITFSQGYTYNGGNLLIGIYNAAKGSWKTVRWYGIDNQSSGVSAYGYHNDNLANVAFKAQKFLPKTTFTYTPAPFSGGSGTQASPYLIASTTDWNNLVSAVNGGETYSGKYFKMTANVGTVSTWMTGTFSGTFDGYGNTLTVGYSATTNNCAPFGYLNGTVQNLKVAGNISTSKQYAGGLAAWVKTGHTANVTNCRVAATINSTFSGDGSSAGFVAYVDGRLNVTGCAFTGTLAGSNAYAWGGFVSYNVGRSDITNCLFAPASVTAKADYSATVGRNGGGTLNFANFYYTQKFNTAQGLQARTIVKGDYVSTLSVTKGSGTTYNVAGITVYSNGVDYNSNFYCGSGQTVSLALTAETRSGYQFTQYAASQGTLSAQTATSATLTMPAANSTANDAVTVTAQYSVPAATAVDLGLPSGMKWADRNVGAGSETGYGTYYAWSSSDIATAQWGNDWRMPTLTEAQELINNTDQEWATIGGVNGTKFMKKTDHSVYIFVPAAGWDGSGNGNIGTAGAYWTSTAQSESRAYEFVIRASGNTTGNDNMTHQFTIRPVQMFAGEGTQASPYLIASTTDWDNLVSAVNAGETYNGNYFKMTANVGTVSTWMTGTFSGTFDGDGKTLTVDYDASTEGCAPFGTLSGATIQNLKVAGSISSNQRLVAGIAALCSSTGNSVTNCLVSATINSSYSGNAADGGLVSVVDNDASLNVTGCAFVGKLLGGGSYASGGIVGWRRTTNACTLTDCLYAPASATGSEVWMTSGESQDGSANFCRYQTSQPAPTLTNCYYTTDFSSGIGLYTAQGIQAYSITGGDYVTVANAGTVGNNYDVSGITSYGTGIQYGGVLYGGNEDAVSLTLTAPEHDGYGFVYSADNGTVTGNSNPYTLTMVDANAIINVKYSASKAINKYTSDDTSDGWYLIASPLDGEVEVDEVEHLQDNVYDLYYFDQSREKEWVNYKEHEGNANPGFDLVSGKGYLYANSGDVTLTFIGTPYSGNGEVSLAYSVDNPDVNMRGWNLVGNPFATTATLNKPFYKMNNDGNGLTAKIEDLNTTIAAMEGVFVQATAEGQSATFTAQTSKGGQQAIAKTNIVLSGNKGKVLDNAIIRFDNGETLGKFYFGEQNANLYIPQDAEEYAIATSNGQGEMPLNFKANANGEYTLTVNPENVEMGYLHLIDNMTGADIDLLQTPEYSFSAKATDYESRFRLVFVCGDANDDNGDNETFAFFSNGSWVIANEGEATLQVIDLNGRILSSETVNGSVSKSINQPAGVYMIRLINGENVKVQKVVIE